MQRGGVLAEQLDFNRLRITLQIANYVRHDADEFNFQSRLAFFDLFAQIGNYLLSAALVPWLQFDREVAAVGLGNKQAQFEAGSQ